ncbi:MAG: AI-2E family transporter [Proteobacteria bacterium]|nr:AI-2E family transporter [Pseudomonadota bacterium]
MNIDLSPQQQRIVAAGVTILAAGVVLTALVLFFVYSVRFLGAFSHIFLPLAVAGVLALVLEPWFNWLKLKAGLPDMVALIVVFLSLLLPISLITIFFGGIIADQIAELIEQLPSIWQRLVAWLKERRPELDHFFRENTLGEKISKAVQEPGGVTADFVNYLLVSAVSAGSGIASGIASLMSWAIAPVYLIFFLLIPTLRPESLSASNFPFLKEETAKDLIYLLSEFVHLVVTFFRGQIVIALLQGILFAIGFSLAGLKYGAVLGLMLGFLNIVPYLGSMLGLAITLPTAWFQLGGGWELLLWIIVVFSIVQMIEGYVLTPRIMGDRTGLHPLTIIIAIFFWGSALGGILGMILAIPLTAFLVVLWRLAREKYIGQLF